MPLDLSIMLFWLKKLLAVVLLPPLLPVLPVLLGLLLMRRHPRAGKTLAWTGAGASTCC